MSKQKISKRYARDLEIERRLFADEQHQAKIVAAELARLRNLPISEQVKDEQAAQIIQSYDRREMSCEYSYAVQAQFYSDPVFARIVHLAHKGPTSAEVIESEWIDSQVSRPCDDVFCVVGLVPEPYPRS